MGTTILVLFLWVLVSVLGCIVTYAIFSYKLKELWVQNGGKEGFMGYSCPHYPQKCCDKCEIHKKCLWLQHSSKIWYVIVLIFILILMATIWFIIADNKTLELYKYTDSFSAKKYTIESSLQNADLSDLTKIQLVEEAAELNGELAEKQRDMHNWRRFDYNNNAKKILWELEPINLSVEN